MKILYIIFVMYLLLVAGCSIISPKEYLNCESYKPPLSQKKQENCKCPEGSIKYIHFGKVFCTTKSELNCTSDEDCPNNEFCVSDDTKRWYCTGLKFGCYYYNFTNHSQKICAD